MEYVCVPRLQAILLRDCPPKEYQAGIEAGVASLPFCGIIHIHTPYYNLLRLHRLKTVLASVRGCLGYVGAVHSL